MTTLHQHAEPCRALDRRLREIVEASAAHDTFRALLGSELLSLQVGWPVLTASATPRASSEIAIELGSGIETAFELALLIPSESAARWVDRALGGSGESGVASASGVLSEGECGVLAYLASRACLAPYQVCDVRPAAHLDAHIAWPLTLESALGRVSLRCAIAPWRAESPVRHRLNVSVFERAPEGLRAGEVWISDGWNLSSTSEGLAGEVQLSVEGCASQLAAIVGAGRVRAHAPSSSRDQLELVLASQDVSFTELAQIGAGEPFRADFSKVELRSEGRTLARGELVSWRGAVGVRINEA
ncbi:MAG TPA: FliM/FliN family flagellar motor C-terminal domain-containing protein [Polyangiales bacterium]|nr:FliM/FliN family flagellar motor C-terminal domain-containing protein [Polyangiales bacterium]